MFISRSCVFGQRSQAWLARLACVALLLAGVAQAASVAPKFEKGDRVVFLGNTFAERLYHFGHLELLLASRYEDLGLTFRNLGWSADEITLMPRPLDFGGVHEHLTMQKANVIFLFYGYNESFAGPEGLQAFKENYRGFVDGLSAHPFSGTTTARLVLVTPYPIENRPEIVGGVARQNANIKLYAQAIAEVAAEKQLPCADIYDLVAGWQEKHPGFSLTINGIHLSAFGDWAVSRMILTALGMPCAPAAFEQDVASPATYVRGPGVKVLTSDAGAVELELKVDYLADVDPPDDAPEGAPTQHGMLKLTGLAPGRYTLTLPGGMTLEGDQAAWAEGMPLNASPFQEEATKVRKDINYKNRLFFDKWRAINGYYIYGGRKEPFGVISFPPEMERFEERVTEYDGKIQKALKQPWTVRGALRRVGE